jgi:hypothetical protein
MKTLIAIASLSIAATSLATPASAYTCSQHYTACLGYGNSAATCACARTICLKAVGSRGDAGTKWNGIPGINACFKK